MDLWKCLYERRSIRRFLPNRQIPEEKIREILDSARYAWSPYNAPPWRLILVRDPQTKQLIGEYALEISRGLFGISYEIFSGHLWYLDPEKIPRIAEYAQSGELWGNYPVDCSFILIPCISLGTWNDGLLRALEPISAACAGMAIQNMWLKAHSMGIGCGCNVMPLNDLRRREELHELLGIPPSWVPLAADCFGYPAVPRMLGPSRAPLESLVYEEIWGNTYLRLGLRGMKVENRIPSSIPGMEIDRAIKSMGQVYRFKQDPVEEWKLERILDAARWAPNPENLNHWRFILIRDPDTIQLIGELTKEAWDGIHGGFYRMVRARYSHIQEQRFLEYLEVLRDEYWKFPLQAPVTILICYCLNWAEYVSGGGGGLPGFSLQLIFPTATGCAIQNMMLAAHGLGLGVNLNVLPLADPRRSQHLQDLLGIPPSWYPLALLHLGYAGMDPEIIPPPDISNLVYNEHWGVTYG